MSFPRLYLAFGLGYLLSYLLRTVNAVISPQLTTELGVGPSSLGLLTSAYFLAFSLAQVPVGVLLDRYGPRRVEPALLLLAAAGALLFSRAHGLLGLLAGRALIGLGVGACLMAPLKAIATWFPREQQASLSGWMMVAGGLGAVASTTPLELALRHLDWREIFAALGLAAVGIAALIAWRIPDTLGRPGASGTQQWALVGHVLGHRRFWWIAPLAATGMGSFMAIQSLWAVPWLMEVEGLSQGAAASRLSTMGLVVVLGYAAIGLGGTRLAKAGAHPHHLVLAGFGLSLGALGCIVLGAPAPGLWWPVYGLGTSVNVLTFAALNVGFSSALAGRTNTALNLAMFGGSFVVQWGLGLIVEAAGDRPTGLKLGFAMVLALEALSFAWFAREWRRQAQPWLPPAAPVA